MKKIIFIVPILILTSACTSTGKIQGVSEHGLVEMEYKQKAFNNDGELNVTMSDGEQFFGKFVQSSSSEFGNSLILGDSSLNDVWALSGSDRVSSQTQAQLVSSQGNTMECQFQFSKPDSGINGGGIGKCITSNKQIITVTF